MTTSAILTPNLLGTTANVSARAQRLAYTGTSIPGNPNGAPALLVLRSGQRLKRTRNGAHPGQTSQTVADSYNTSVRQYQPGIVIVQGLKNDTANTTSVQAGIVFQDRVIAQARADGCKVLVCGEPLNANSANTGDSAAQAALAAVLYARTDQMGKYGLGGTLAGEDVMFFDTASMFNNLSTGAKLTPDITATGTVVSGTATFAVSGASGTIVPGMCVFMQATGGATGQILSGSYVRVQTFDGTNVTVYPTPGVSSGGPVTLLFGNTTQDNVHFTTEANEQIADAQSTAMVNAGWITNRMDIFRPLTTTSTDNLLTNGTLEGTVTGNVAAGLSTQLGSSALAVVTNANFQGKAQQAVLPAGQAAGIVIQSAAASVRGPAAPLELLGRRIAIGVKIQASNIRTNALQYSVTAIFDVTPSNVPASSPETTNLLQGFNYAGIDAEGLMNFYGEVYVPMDASTMRIAISTVNAVPSGATSLPTFLIGELFIQDIDDPLKPTWVKRTTRTTALTAATTIVPTDDIVPFNITGAVSQPLPLASSMLHQAVVVKNMSSSTASVTLTVAGSDTIDGATTLVLTAGQAQRVYAQAANTWMTI
jgi:hypothetical protein